jgi:cation transport regulator
MPDQQINDLPSEVKEKLPEGAQNIFLAAFNSSRSDGLSEQAALNVGWNSVKQGYEEGADGKWHRKPDASNANFKAVPTGGN